MNLSGALNAPGMKVELPQGAFTSRSSLETLRSAGDANGTGQESESELELAAREFSSIFLHMALKSMREASFGGGILDSQQSEFYRDMFDEQIARDLSDGEGFGLTQLIVDQLSAGAGNALSGEPRPNAVQAYSDVAQSTQVSENPADTEPEGSLSGGAPSGFENSSEKGRAGANVTARLAIP